MAAELESRHDVSRLEPAAAGTFTDMAGLTRTLLADADWSRSPTSMERPAVSVDTDPKWRGATGVDHPTKAQLNELLVEKLGSDSARLISVRRDIETFEQRCQRQGVAPEKVEATYEQLARLLRADTNAVLSHDERVLLVEQSLAHLADPFKIDQGIHPTCGYAALESSIMNRHPNAAARFLADLGTAGSYSLADGTRISLDRDSLRPDWSLQTRVADGGRSYASQLFQVGAANIRWQTESTDERLGTFPRGSKRYFQTTDRSSSRTGDGVLDVQTGTVVKDWGGYASKQQLDFVASQILRTTETPHVFDFTQVHQLRQSLLALKKQHGFPASVLVPLSNQAIYHDYKRRYAREPRGNHWVNVTNYDPQSDSVSIDNWWGKSADRDRVPLQHLFQSANGTASSEKDILLPSRSSESRSWTVGASMGTVTGIASSLILDAGLLRLGVRGVLPRLGTASIVVFGAGALGAYLYKRWR